MPPTHRTRSDAGLSLAELLVAMLIATLIAATGVQLVIWGGRLMMTSGSSTTTMGELESASTQLLRDVQDARQVIDATSSSLTLEVVRDGACVRTAWTAADGSLTVARTTFVQADSATGDPACADTGGERAELTVVRHLDDLEPFTYFSKTSTSTPLTAPVRADDVARVAWSLTATPAYPRDAKQRTIASGAALSQRTGTSGGGQNAGDPRSPLLEVVTPHEGVDAPVLAWTDPTHALTQNYTLYRIAYAEGEPASTTWQALITLPATESSYRDVSLARGWTARYLLRATTTDGRQGPTSNQVATGRRPTATTATATGQTTAIRVDWPAVAGADSYDIYRDGVLVAVERTGTTWTDATGRGHAHSYLVVPVNRWERCATVSLRCTEANQTRTLNAGTAASAVLPTGGVRRTLSAEASAWSAPPAVTDLTAARQPVQGSVDDPGSAWDARITVSWTASAWTGAYADAARAATRYAVARTSTGTALGTTASTSMDDASAPRGAVGTWSITPSAGGLTGPGAATQRLTYPDAPACSVELVAGAETRSARVHTADVAGGSAYRTRLTWRSGARGEGAGSSPVPLGTILGRGAVYDPLPHSTAHSWRGQAAADGGGEAGIWGPWGGECGTTTGVLEPPAVPDFAAPTCTGTVSGYAPATIAWTRSSGSTGWVYRQAQSASGAGTYSAQAYRSETAARTDGFSRIERSATRSSAPCSATIDPPPILAPACATPRTNLTAGSLVAAVEICRMAGAISYEAEITTRDRIWGAPHAGALQAWAPPITPDAGTGRHVITTTISPAVVADFRWRVRAIYLGRASDWLTTAWVTVPAG